ncbi:hypothetical protein [Streptosporangium sp. NPDC048865]|uniref:hypothetical protein n=1 Tax=Streptosporangium sp. NPDC048865 TaxID=3155766 RepID=UPI00344758C9
MPDGWERPPARVGAALLAEAVWPPGRGASVFVCGSTGFVETVAGLLVSAGHDPRLIRTERFGPGAGRP